MIIFKRILLCISLLFATVFLSVGYAALSNELQVSGNISGVAATKYDVYISSVFHKSGDNVTEKQHTSTILFTTVSGNGSTTFDVTVKNISEKDYVYMGVIDGKFIGTAGVYTGNDITYSVSGITELQQINKLDGILTFSVTITSKNNATTDNYVLKFNFVEKTGSEILPGGDEEDDTPVELAIPVVTINETGLASWIAVEHASGYNYRINGSTSVNTSGLFVQLSPGDSIEVKALGDDTKYITSEYCLPVTYNVIVEPEPEKIKLSTPIVTIDNETGVASWNNVDNAISYVYVINDGEPTSTKLTSVKLIYNQMYIY